MLFKLYPIALVSFFALDMLWLAVIMRRFYTERLGFLMNPNINWLAAGSFYVLFVIGLIIFVVMPSLEHQSLFRTALLGALFGLIAYATYDLTNLATLKHWPVLVTVVDMAWGATLSAIVSVITYTVATRLGW
jgi:uncharacterized membrane protein